ncbi:MAG TPA: VanZ family protein [Gemmatimonadales bacterium]|nr:VanZ family protein [Gemmatimonadales bacterium]
MTRSFRSTRWGGLIAAAGLGFIAAMTLVPRPEEAVLNAQTPPWCLICGSLGGVDVLLNVLLFVPYGFGLRLAGWSWRRTAIIVLATTIGVETLQLWAIAGRDASISDIITNTTGGLLGAWLAGQWAGVILPARETARRLAIVGGAIWLGILLISGALLHTSYPLNSYYGQWAADLPGLAKFQGRILSAEVDGMPIPSHRIRETRELRRRLQAGVIVHVTAIMDGPTSSLAPVFSIFDKHQRNILMLGQDGRGFEFDTRMRTTLVKLRPPTLRLEPTVPLVSGDTVELTARLVHSRLGLRVASSRGVSQREFDLSPGLGWAMLLPYDYAYGSAVEWLTALWLGGLLIPVGYWAASGWAGRHALAALVAGAAGLAVLGMGVVPLLVNLPAVSWSAWLATIAGYALGWALGWRRN